MKTYSVTLTGKSALLMHNDNIDGADALQDWRRKNKNTPAGDDRHPSWTWKTYLYFDGAEEHVSIPAPNIMACLRGAGAKKILNRNTTYKAYTQTDILVTEDFALFGSTGEQISKRSIDGIDDGEPFAVHRDSVKALGFILDMRRAKVGTSKHIRVRPYFARGWVASGMIYVTNESVFPEDVLKEIFDIAGAIIGVGDYRPGGKTPGMFGKFNAEISAV